MHSGISKAVLLEQDSPRLNELISSASCRGRSCVPWLLSFCGSGAGLADTAVSNRTSLQHKLSVPQDSSGLLSAMYSV